MLFTLLQTTAPMIEIPVWGQISVAAGAIGLVAYLLKVTFPRLIETFATDSKAQRDTFAAESRAQREAHAVQQDASRITFATESRAQREAFNSYNDRLISWLAASNGLPADKMTPHAS